MNYSKNFYSTRNDRSLRYAQRVLDSNRPIAVTVEQDYLESIPGQAAVIVVANLLARMSPNVALAFPDTTVLGHVRSYAGESLHDYVLTEMRGADPFGSFGARKYQQRDY